MKARLPLDALRQESAGHPEVVVAILDSAVDFEHPCFTGADLSRAEVLGSTVAASGPALAHGTHVTSVVLGQPGSPVEGIAPRCRGLIVPLFRTDEVGAVIPCSQLDLARGISLALQHGARVINISGGQLDPSGEAHPRLAESLDLCARQGVMVIAAAGNDGCACLHVPAATATVLAVGAMGADAEPMEISNWGEQYQGHGILAPGQDILGAVPGGGTVRRSGTSFATAVVSGVAALLLSVQRQRTGSVDSRRVFRALLDSTGTVDPRRSSDPRRNLMGRLDIEKAHLYLRGGIVEQPDMQKSLQPGAEAPAVLGPEAIASQLESAQTHPVSLGQVAPSGCGCGAGGAGEATESRGEQPAPQPPPLAYALGQVGYDFGTEARRDSFFQQGISNPFDAQQLLAYLADNPFAAASVTWTLNQETTPIYAIQPVGGFAAETYQRLREFVHGQLNEGVERVSIPGVVAGQTTLTNGQTVPVLMPELRGMFSWSTAALVSAVLGDRGKGKDAEAFDRRAAEIRNFLERIYYEVRNVGIAPQERAMNFAATNAFQAGTIFQQAIAEDLKLDAIDVGRSPISRPDADGWDVKLVFFNPAKRLEQARVVYRFTVDVSDIVPVTVGHVRSWHVF